MTIADLIEKLKAEKDSNGAYAVLSMGYEKLKGYVEQCNILKDDSVETIEAYLRNSERINEQYTEISGFIWGLYVANYISEAERNELTNELLEMMDN